MGVEKEFEFEAETTRFLTAGDGDENLK